MGFVDILPPSVRKVLYIIWGVSGLVLGALAAAFGSVPGAEFPTWYVVAGAVWAFLGTALGFTAAANTGTTPPAVVELAPGVLTLTNATEPHGAVPVPVYDVEQRARYAEGGAVVASDDDVSKDLS